MVPQFPRRFHLAFLAHLFCYFLPPAMFHIFTSWFPIPETLNLLVRFRISLHHVSALPSHFPGCFAPGLSLTFRVLGLGLGFIGFRVQV